MISTEWDSAANSAGSAPLTRTNLDGASVYGIDLTSSGRFQVDFGVSFEGLTLASGDYPSPSNVRDGVAYASGSYTGNMTEPAEADVKASVPYGAFGTEYTGTFSGGSGNGGFVG